ncbi:uncharacterized protein KY384_003864 [Bacidia gigantensis]|uniref:uncharacterized protein n=1 Tax=Bacidia gigantensis TaxID=2732470 RepID=UPI001D05B36A|nr:uncharacterized protein KY384_003864 [Bacidia gigantensis]KAG8532223.1 hypothetical protein KY384_003864 [Bacidia gigantensis]
MASRSFHSTKILRYLFIVHAALSEFALASKALNSYLEIIKKGKAKQKKSGERNISLDDDATALCTIVCGVEMLCTYGKRKDVEQAQDLVHLIEDWLVSAQSDEDIQVESSAEDTPVDLVDKPKRASLSIPTKIMARAYAAIGLSRRCWALLTYDSISRAKLQESAISAYRSALRSEYGDEDNVEHLYSLAYVLAQTRKLEDAMITVKQAITIGKHLDLGMSKPAMVDGTSSEGDSDFPNRVTLLKCWHLVALLLSARQDFSTAVTSCEAAVDPYGGKKVLSGDLRSLDLPPDLGFVEKRNIIELKMTHIALLEVMGESESFVNKVTELLGLYSRLFKLNDDVNLLKPETRDSSPAPSTTGTRRSFRQSILHLPKNPLRHRLADNESVTSSVGSSKPIANGDAKPAIAITTDDTIVLPQNPKHHQGFLGRHESNKLKKRPSRRSLNSVRKSRASSPSMPPPAKSHDTKHLNLPINPDQDQSMQSDSQDPSIQGSDVETTQYSPDQIGVAMSHNQQSKDSAPIASADHSHPLYTIPSAAENMNKTNPNSNPILPNPPSSSGSRPTTSLMPLIEIPEPHYTPSIQARQARALLCRIWLFMSGVYRRASMYQECQKAINEAREQVKAVEKSIAENEGMSAETYTSPGYGGYKSCGQLWGDVCAEQGALWEAQDNTAKAVDSYEMALSNDGDHLVATASLSNILLDQYATPPNKPAKPKGLEPPPVIPTLGSLPYTTAPDTSVNIDTSEDTLNRLAARDRAYGMLSMLTKSGQGWDSTDAWFAMARVHEESGQAEKAQQTYWWVIELEEAKGVRSWDVIA